MPGFGGGPFGSGPFGSFDWAKQTLFRDLPEVDRVLDREVGGGRLELWSDAIKPTFDELLRFVRGFGDLRDPDTVRTQFNGVLSVTLLSTEINTETGRTTYVFVEDLSPNDPFDPLGGVSVGWILEDSQGREFTVNSVCKLINRIEVGGIVAPIAEDEFPGEGAATIRPRALIQRLGGDFGIEVDQHEPEAFQRSSVRNAVQWLDLKGSAKSYDIIGKIAGYRVVPVGLWRISNPPPSGIPVSEIFESPLGSGKFYTTLAPARPRFDNFPVDTIPLDQFCFEEVKAPPPSPVPPPGTTVEEAIGIGAGDQLMPIVSTTDLGGNRWEVRVTGDLSGVFTANGTWYATFSGIGADRFFLETVPVEGPPGDWTFEVLAGPSPTFGATADVGYECVVVSDCGICRASVLRIEVTPVEVITDPDALLDGVLDRLTRKILQVIPAHVRVTEIELQIGPVQAILGISIGLVQANTTVNAPAQVGFYFDLTPADAIPLDPAHMIATGTVFTTP